MRHARLAALAPAAGGKSMRRLTARLDRLEVETQQRRRGRFILHYMGEPLPEEIDLLDLVLTLHREWCATPEHSGPCFETQFCVSSSGGSLCGGTMGGTDGDASCV